MSNLPLPGTIGLTQITGDAGKVIRVGQWAVAKLDRVREIRPGEDWADYQHAFLHLGGGQIIEAEPGGARIRDVFEYTDVYWCDRIAGQYTPEQLARVADYARDYEGTPYSFLDYAAIAAHTLHVPAPGLREYIQSTEHLICSQLCDVAYQDAGLHLFTEPKRWPGYVDPLDLYLLDQSL